MISVCFGFIVTPPSGYSSTVLNTRFRMSRTLELTIEQNGIASEAVTTGAPEVLYTVGMFSHDNVCRYTVVWMCVRVVVSDERFIAIGNAVDLYHVLILYSTAI